MKLALVTYYIGNYYLRGEGRVLKVGNLQVVRWAPVTNQKIGIASSAPIALRHFTSGLNTINRLTNKCQGNTTMNH